MIDYEKVDGGETGCGGDRREAGRGKGVREIARRKTSPMRSGGDTSALRSVSRSAVGI